MKLLIAAVLVLLSSACGPVEFPTRPTRAVPGFYSGQQEPPIAVDLSNQPCIQRFRPPLLILCPQ